MNTYRQAWKLAGVGLVLTLALMVAGVGAAWAQDDVAVGAVNDATATTASQGYIPDETFGVFAGHIKLQLFDRQQLLGLPVNSASYYFTIPAGIVLGSGTLNLHIASSDTLIEERSSITVEVNGNRLETVPITSIGDAGNGWWAVEVPATYLHVGGFNQLTFLTAHRSIEGDCADIDNPSNWVALEADSHFTMQVEGYPSLLLANALSTFYDSVFAGTNLSASFVLPQSANSAVLNDGALTLAAAAGAYKTGANAIDFTSTTAAAVDGANHSIFIGWQDSWATTFRERQMQTLNAGQGYLETAGAPDAVGGYKLLVSGADDEGTQRAIDLAAASTYLSQLPGSSAVVTSNVAERAPLEASDNGVYTFADLGYNTTSLAGAFHQTATFALPQPNNVQCGPASTVTINFSHSKALQADRSLLTVKINGTEIDSVQLSNSNAVGGTITVIIPEAARSQAVIRVEVDVYNYIGKIDCSKDYYDVAWTVIDESSNVFFDPSDLRIRPRLSDFLQFNLWSEVPGNQVITHASALSDSTLNLAARTGQRNATALSFALKPLSNTASTQDKENNLIYVGSVDELALPDELQAELVAEQQANGTYAIAADAPFINETLANKVVFQVVRSPWNFDKYVYVISYPAGQEARCSDILQDNDLLSTLAGTISCVDDQGLVSTYDAFSKIEGEAAPLSYETVQYKVYQMFGIPLWWFIGGIVLLIVLIVACIFFARRRAQFKRMERKIKEENKELVAKNGVVTEEKEVEKE